MTNKRNQSTVVGACGGALGLMAALLTLTMTMRAGGQGAATASKLAKPAASRPGPLAQARPTTSAATKPITVLSGVQNEDLITLATRKEPYKLVSEYYVPRGKKLLIEEGVILLAASGSKLSISGSLVVRGTESNTVQIKGERGGLNSWQGISCKEGTLDLECAWISDANEGLRITKTDSAKLRGCVFFANFVGVHAGDYGSGSTFEITDCVLSYNEINGLEIFGSKGKITSSTISRNGRWGIFGEYYASPAITKSIITQNLKGGIHCGMYECKVEAHESFIGDNKVCDVENACPEDWDFTRCWWGEARTKLLKERGPTVKLPGIVDAQSKKDVGKVRLQDFLEKMPECGAKVTKIQGRPLR